MTKLQNYFKPFLSMNYREFKLARDSMTANESVVAELLRVCCEEDEVKAMKMAFERILGKPEKVIIIKRTLLKIVYPDAKTKSLKPVENLRVLDESEEVEVEKPVVVQEADAPGAILRKEVDSIGESPSIYAYDVIEDKDKHTVAHVFAANVYATAMRGGNLAAIDLLFDYLDGCVADVIRLEGEQTVVLENYADTAPYEAKLGADGVYYIEKESVS